MNEWKYCLKCNKIYINSNTFQQYLHSFIQFAMFTGRVARQTNRLYVLRMIVKLAYTENISQPLRGSVLLHYSFLYKLGKTSLAICSL